MSINDAIKYCKDWVTHRRWLKANNVKFADFKEEIEFQEFIKEFDFDERAVRVQMTQSIKAVAQKLADKDIIKIRAKNALIRNRKEFLDKQDKWNSRTKKTVSAVADKIR